MFATLQRPAPARAALFTVADLPRFAPYVNARARWSELSAQGRKFCDTLAAAREETRAALTVFTSDLSDASFAHLLDVAGAGAKYQTVLALDPQLATAVRTVYPESIFMGEFPTLKYDLAAILDFMGEHYLAELERVRPEEEERLTTQEAHLEQYGANSHPLDALETRSPVLRRLTDNLARLRADAEKLRAGTHPNPPLYVAGQYIDPVLQTIS